MITQQAMHTQSKLVLVLMMLIVIISMVAINCQSSPHDTNTPGGGGYAVYQSDIEPAVMTSVSIEILEKTLKPCCGIRCSLLGFFIKPLLKRMALST